MLYVCLTCKKVPQETDDGEPSADQPHAGRSLFEALLQAKSAGSDDDVQIVGVDCLSNCKRSCTIALASEGRWTYVYGDMDPETSVNDIIDGARRYAASSDGIIPWRERPLIFRKNVIARIPPLNG